MCTPIGHTLAGGTLFLLQPLKIRMNPVGGFLFLLIAANLPDMDYLFGYIAGYPNLYHHGWTHSLFFAVLSGLLVFMSGKIMKRDWAIRAGMLTTGLVLIHLLLDFFTIDRSLPYGMQLLWPITNVHLIAPVTFWGDLHKSSDSATFIPSLFVWYNLRTVALETVILLPLFTGVWIMEKKRNILK